MSGPAWYNQVLVPVLMDTLSEARKVTTASGFLGAEGPSEYGDKMWQMYCGLWVTNGITTL